MSNLTIHKSDIFDVRGKDIFLNIVSRYDRGLPAWICAFIGIVALIAGCITDDMRPFVVGLILLLAITPSVCVFLYYYHLLASDMVANILPHSLERHSDGLLVTVYRRIENQEEEENVPVEWSECSSIFIPDSSVVKVRRYSGYYLLYLAGAPLKALYVPADVFLQLDYENP